MRAVVFVFSALLLAMNVVPASAQTYSIRVGDGTVPTFTQGSTGELPVYLITGSPPSGGTLQAFNLAFDFDSTATSGLGVRPGFSGFQGRPLGADSWVPINLKSGAAFNYDFDFGGSGLSESLSNPIKLFDLRFQIGMDAALDTYSVLLLENAAQGDALANRLVLSSGPITPPSIASTGGSFQVAAVPEPASAILVALSGAGIAFSRWRRSRNAK